MTPGVRGKCVVGTILSPLLCLGQLSRQNHFICWCWALICAVSWAGKIRGRINWFGGWGAWRGVVRLEQVYLLFFPSIYSLCQNAPGGLWLSGSLHRLASSHLSKLYYWLSSSQRLQVLFSLSSLPDEEHPSLWHQLSSKLKSLSLSKP